MTGAPGRPRAQDVDRHIGARLREFRVAAGLSQAQLAELIGVTYQQAHKYETGVNRIAAGRLYAIADVLGVEPGAFFEGLAGPKRCVHVPGQRAFLEHARQWRAIRDGRHRDAISLLTRILAGMDTDRDYRQEVTP